MRRRNFIALLGGAVAVWPLAAQAQQPEYMRRIGVLIGTGNDADGQARIAVFKKTLEELGWREGANTQFDIRWASGDAERAAAFAKELVELQPNVILGHNTISVDMLLRTTRSIPIVFVSIFDPVGSGFVSNIARPGANITGFSNHEFSMAAKWIEFLKEMVPNLSKISLMFNPKTAPYAEAFYSSSFEKGAYSLGLTPSATRVSDTRAIEQTIMELSQPGTGLAVMADPFTTVNRKLIIDLVAKHAIPTVYPWNFFTRAGGLLSYSVDQNDIFRRAAGYVDRILRGEKPGDLPVQAPVKWELMLNLKTAKALGLEVPHTLLVFADELIE